MGTEGIKLMAYGTYKATMLVLDQECKECGSPLMNFGYVTNLGDIIFHNYNPVCTETLCKTNDNRNTDND